jgi:superfamily I DNA/RNA helicase
MHRMKGLEFSRVLLVGVGASTMPLATLDYEDEARREEHENQERCLLYVACSRARDELAIAGHGDPSPFLSN